MVSFNNFTASYAMKKELLVVPAFITTVILLTTCTRLNKETEVVQEEAGFDSPRTVNNDPRPAYLTPEESLNSFRLPKGYHLELVADESMLSEPVAISWDGNGRMFGPQMETYNQPVDPPVANQPA